MDQEVQVEIAELAVLAVYRQEETVAEEDVDGDTTFMIASTRDIPSWHINRND